MTRRRRPPKPIVREPDRRTYINTLQPQVVREDSRILTIPNLTDYEHGVLREVCQKTLRGLRGN